ncbi:MAG: xanthine dehydrogenase family protein molybdopterin-binding subunit, partial [Acidimicrobiales bacterium]|nr:xanthine dehydrogenase family protein molybdopterin-binding subunit [Acidimicrobiales bacterium]
MMTSVLAPSIGTPLGRLEGREKVTGLARYAVEYPIEHLAYAVPVQASIAAGQVATLDAASLLSEPGVLAVISNENAPRLRPVNDGELALFQSRTVSYRGQIVAAVVADSLEVATDAAARCQVEYLPRPHDVLLRADHPGLYRPEKVNPSFETDTEEGDVDGALIGAANRVEVTYETPAFHNNPMEPHASLARWDEEGLTVYDSTQAPFQTREVLAEVFRLAPEQVRVIAPHVGGGFGSKGTPRPQVVLAAMAARMTARPVKVALTRQQMFALTGYRTPTIQTVRLAADGDGRLEVIAHEVIEQTSTVREFAEQTALPSRMMYAGPNRRTRHRLVRLDVPSPSWMRAPGECPGMYALESAMDELAIACRLDPLELRVRNEPEADPETGLPFSSRHLADCLREGADRFGWAPRDPTPGTRREGRWLVGTGLAASTYPARRRPSGALARTEPDGTFTVALAAVDIGTGARTALTQIAADALGVGTDRVRLLLGDSSL